MTTEELSDTIAAAITSHSHRSSVSTLKWEVGLVMSAVEKHVALRLRDQADKLDDGTHNAAELLREEAGRLETVSEAHLRRLTTSSPRITSAGQTPPTETEGER
ncbi:hypothetical protein [Streptomyces sp. Ac-502]|uniref:hypothetical protein n=1 Tax=Streptomyces sp. Ac-502 TaxID=3342801 RepID=UPI003862D267